MARFQRMITTTLANCLSEIFECTVRDHNGNHYQVFDLLNSGNDELLGKEATYDEGARQILIAGEAFYTVV